MNLIFKRWSKFIILFMKANFRINLPSIPSSVIKFKVQDYKTEGFLSKDIRFSNDKSRLTQKFANSFANLEQSTFLNRTKQSENSSYQSTNLSSSFVQPKNKFRRFISANQKNLLINFQANYKKYQAPVRRAESLQNGHVFGKQDRKLLQNSEKKYQNQLIVDQDDKIFDNSFFKNSNKTQQSLEDYIDEKEQLQKRRNQKLQKKKYVLQSASFKSEDRWEQKQRMLRNKIQLGPGSYQLPSIRPKIKKNNKKNNPQIQLIDSKKKVDFMKQLKQKIHYNSEDNILETFQKKSNKVPSHQSSMFAYGNTDRFGQQVFPINPKLKVPGPGSYQIKNSIQDRSNKVLLIQEQRKLLQEWYYGV